MSSYNTHDAEQLSARHHGHDHGSQNITDLAPSSEIGRGAPSILSHVMAQGSFNMPRRAEAMHSMQRTHGNRAVQRSTHGQQAQGGVPVQRFMEEAGELWNSSKNAIGLGNDVVGGGTSTLGVLSDVARIGEAQQRLIAPMPSWLTGLPGGGNYSPLARNLSQYESLADMSSLGTTAQNVSPFGSAMSKVGTAANVLGIGLGMEKMYNGKGYDVLEGGADATASAIGLSPHPLAKSFSAGYGVGRLLDQGVGWGMDKLSHSETGEDLGMNPGADYSLSGMLGKHVFAQDHAISNLMPWSDDTLAYNPETDDPTKVDRSYENTFAWQINQALENETVTRVKDEFLADPTGLRRSYKATEELYQDHLAEPISDFGEAASETYSDVKEGAGEMYDDASDYAEEKIEAVKEFIPDIEIPAIEANPLKWF
jgi:hypothetical protein